jgi:putative effector of murein hydrolase
MRGLITIEHVKAAPVVACPGFVSCFLGVVLLLCFDKILHRINPVPHVPVSLLGMCLVVTVGVYLKQKRPDVYTSLEKSAAPAVNWITHSYLALFYSPTLVSLPKLLIGDITGQDIALSLGVICVGCFLTAAFTGWSLVALRHWMLPAADGARQVTMGDQTAHSRGRIRFSRTYIIFWACTGCIMCLGTAWVISRRQHVDDGGEPMLDVATRVMIGLMQASLTICGYIFGVYLPDRVKNWIHPMICCAILPNVAAYVFSQMFPWFLSYKEWVDMYLPQDGFGPGHVFFSFLGPIIICFGFRIVEQWDILMANKVEILACCIMSSAFTMISTAFLAGPVLHVSRRMAVSLIPRGATLALALPISKILGGIPQITAAAVAGTGLIGGNFIYAIMGILGLRNVLVRGITAAAVAHGLGSAAIGSIEPDTLPYAGIAYLICGTSAVLWTTIPQFVTLLLHIVSN